MFIQWVLKRHITMERGDCLGDFEKKRMSMCPETVCLQITDR